MSNIIQTLFQHIQNARRWVRVKTEPVRSKWLALTAPIREFLSPVTNKWLQLTAPMRTWWAGFKQRRPMPATILGWTGRLIKWGFYFLLALIIGVWIGLFGRLPNKEELKNVETANSTEIYTADSVLIGKYYIENRTAISLDNVSPHIINALIATEDRRFLEHSGIDVMSWLRVVKGMVSRQDNLGGGSTLSQQLAKNLYPRRDYHIPGVSLVINKIRENFISIRLEKVYNKQELLNLYLNTVPFGGDIFGISVASRQYFNKKPKDLSVDQASTLVGMLKATTYYNPVRNPENAKKRRNIVLRQMVKNGHLTNEEYDELSKKPVGAKRYNVDSNLDGLGTYFREYLRTDVMPKILKNNPKEDGSSYNLYTDGLKIYTTLHSKMQQYGEEAVGKHMKDLQRQFDQHWKTYKKEKPWGDDKWIDEQIKRSTRWENLKDAGLSDEEILATFDKPVPMTIFSWRGARQETDTILSPIDSVRYYFCLLNCGFMTMDHRNGYVRAWVGGTNFKYFKFDHIKSTRQVGSTFKPIVYAAALQDSIRPCTYFPNQIKKIVDWEPHNSDERYGGWYTLTGGLTKSVNVIAAQLIEKVGIQKTIDLAQKMGVTSKLPREFGISLGAADISLYDMIKVYGTLANQGKRPEPVVVLQVLNRDGEVIYDYKSELLENSKLGAYEQALTPTQASIMTEMMQNVVLYGTAHRLHQAFPQCEFAGKTGTTQNHSDGWFICYNTQLVTGAWVGAPSPAVRFRSMYLGQGSAMALPIVSDFWFRMSKNPKLSKMLFEKFPDPKPEVQSLLGCIPWIGIQPDSFMQLMQDSTIRDSIIAAYRNRPKSGEEEVADDTPGGESEGDDDTGEKKGLFRKIFSFSPKNKGEKEDKDNKSKSGEKPKGRKEDN